MSSKKYDHCEHTFASVNCERGKEVFPIVHHTMSRVWLMVYHSDRLEVPHENVGDGTSDAYDDDGYHIVSVLIDSCEAFHDDNEALSIQAMKDVDDKIMGWAR